MKCIIDDRRQSLIASFVERIAEIFAGLRADEIDDRRHAAFCRFARSCAPIVLRCKYPRIELDMAMGIDDAWQDDLPRTIDDFVVGRQAESIGIANGNNLAVVDTYIDWEQGLIDDGLTVF